MKKILVAVDGSEPSSRALKQAAELAKPFGATLVCCHVTQPVFVPPEPFGFNTVQVEQANREWGEKLLNDAVTGLKAQGIDAEPRLLLGAPADMLAQEADTADIDLVAVGSRGFGAVGRMLLGSVSSRLVHICRKPVVVVH